MGRQSLRKHITEQPTPPLIKRCRTCGEEKPATAFGTRDPKTNLLRLDCRPCNARLAREYRDKYPKRPLLSNAKQRAKQSGVPFNLKESDFSIPVYCPVLGLKLERSIGQRGVNLENSPSLDRITPSRGYVKDNVIVISHRANTVKGAATIDELLALAAFYGQFKGTRP